MPDKNQKIKAKKGTLLSRAALLLTVLAAAALMGLLAYSFHTPNLTVWQARQTADVSHITDYSLREISSLDTPMGVKEEYRFTLGEAMDQDKHLAFYTVHQYAEVFIDGQLVYSMKPSEENRIGKTIGSNWCMIPLYREDAGKEVVVELTPVYESFRGWKVDFLLGSPLSIYRDRLRQDLPQLVLSVAAMFVGVVVLCIAGYQVMIRRQNGGVLAGLGLFTAMIGIWRLTDTRFTPFMSPDRPVFLFNTSLAMLMLGAVALVRSVKARRRESRVPDLLSIALAAAFLVEVILQYTNAADLRESLPVTHIALVLTAAVLTVTAFCERRKHPSEAGRQQEDKLPFVMLVGAAADVAAYYIRGTSSGLIFSLSALIIYTVFKGISFMDYYRRQEKVLLEQKAELERSKIAITLSQIQPHFLYNALCVIQDLCHGKAPDAEKATVEFSEFLRANLDSLSADKPIPFARELRHVRNYLALEQRRFGEDLRVVYNIGPREFYLPALTLQPIVENAVRYGVMQREDGGTIWISTEEGDGFDQVIVKDNGVGFDVNSPKVDGRTHIGIDNVRNRLQQMCGGQLSIESVPGAGTTVILTIPNREEETNEDRGS